MPSSGGSCFLEMKYLISLYAWIVGGLYFLVFCIVGILLSFFMKPQRFDPLLKAMMRGVFKIIFVKVKRKGVENVQQGRTYLFMSNHESLFDIPAVEGYVPTFIRGVEALRQFRWPVYGWLIRRHGNIPIDRKNIYASLRSMKKTAEVLKNGQSMIILPEGHRTLDGKMGPFKKFPFHLAKQAGVPIIPIGLSGLFELKNKNSWLIRPRPITIAFGSPIEEDTIKRMSLEELRQTVRQRIQDLLEKEK
jgi:1-acyl-sn-glycerol-3-phosphate acyltransferase